MTDAPDPLKEAALRYAQAGQPVFPCRVLGKQPNGKLARHGVKDASSRPSEVTDWWTRVPRSNVGWPTQVRGADSFALDVDTKNGVDGWATVARLNAQHANDPIPLGGPQSTTPSKPPDGLKAGGHIWLRARDELPVPNKVSFAPGLDTRGQGGYVVVAPSRTEDGEYRGDPPLDPSLVPYAPNWLLDMIRGPTGTARPVASAPPRSPAGTELTTDEAVRVAAEYWKPGNRRLLTHGLAVFFGRDLGLSQDRTEELVQRVAKAAGDTGDIARDKIRDAWKKVGTGERASVRYWLGQAGVPELGVRLFALLRGAAPARSESLPWAGKPGWEEEPELRIKMVPTVVGRGENKEIVERPVDPAYLDYNILVTGQGFRPFRTLSGEPRVAVPTEYGVEVHDPRSPEFVDWVGFRYYAVVGDRMPTKELGVVAKVLAGRASAPELPRTRVVDLSIRVAPVGRYASLLDLGDPQRRCIRIEADGWSVERVGSPFFERPSHMLPLPEPERAGGTDGDWTRAGGLFRFVSIGVPDPDESKNDQERAERERRLEGQKLLVLAEVVHFLLSPRSPKVIPILNGDDGSGKSHAAGKLGAVVDPSIVQHVPVPETEQDLLALALNRATVSIDNVSHINHWLSDALARLCTGTGLAKRRLYTDRDEVVSRLIPRIILNGITAIPRSPDLIRRALFLWADRPEQTLGDEEYEAAWDAAHPGVLGGFLDLACLSARILRDSPPPGNGDSMADFVRIGRAVALATGETAKDFDTAWAENQSRQLAAAEENPWVGALQGVFGKLTPGEAITPEKIARQISEGHRDSFPKGVTSQEVGNAISRVRSTLRRLKLPIERRKGTAGVRLYFVGSLEKGATGATQSKLPSEESSGTPSGTPPSGATPLGALPGGVPPGCPASPSPDSSSENPSGVAPVAPVAPLLRLPGAEHAGGAESDGPRLSQGEVRRRAREAFDEAVREERA